MLFYTFLLILEKVKMQFRMLKDFKNKDIQLVPKQPVFSLHNYFLQLTKMIFHKKEAAQKLK